MNSTPPDNSDIEQQLNEFIQDIDALMLATVNTEGLPEASYAPFVNHADSYYIFVSELASHTRNLKQSGEASVILMGFENSAQAHTRKRLSCYCKAETIEPNTELFELIMQLMEQQFGNLIVTLRSLKDFQLFQLNPVKGNFVAGFGKAFEIDFSQGRRIRHRQPD